MDQALAAVIDHGLTRLNCDWVGRLTLVDTLSLYDRGDRLLVSWRLSGNWVGYGSRVEWARPRGAVVVRWQPAWPRTVAAIHSYWVIGAGMMQRARTVSFVRDTDGLWVLDQDQPRILDTSRAIDPMRGEIEELLTA